MRTIILGAGGQLGADLAEIFRTDHPVTAFARRHLDVTDESAVRRAFETNRPELVLNAAAYTNVDAAEDDPATAFKVNADTAEIVARAAATIDATVVYVSTDYVFDGSKRTPYEPDDPIDPAGVYARSKAAGEEATRSACPRHFVVRTAWLYGPGGNNFVEKIIRAASTRTSLNVVEDEVGSPTHTYDLAEAILALSRSDAYGVYHAANAGQCSRIEFARAILRGIGSDTVLEPCSSAEFPTKARRPVYSVLSSTKLEAATGYSMRPWERALDHYLSRRDNRARGMAHA